MVQQLRQKMVHFVHEVGSEEEIEKFYKKYCSERFILPLPARILSGIMQSISIRQGYLVESLIRDIIQHEVGLVLHEFSGVMKTELVYTKQSQSTIHRYIEEHYKSRGKPLPRDFSKFLRTLRKHEADDTHMLIEGGNYNIDIMFLSSREGEWYIFECKFCDNHDAIQLLNIHKKLFTIYAGVLNALRVDSDKQVEKIHPCLYYFNDYKISKNKYLPEEYIYRGETLFKKFFVQTSYQDMLQCFHDVKRSHEMREALNSLQHRVRDFVRREDSSHFV